MSYCVPEKTRQFVFNPILMNLFWSNQGSFHISHLGNRYCINDALLLQTQTVCHLYFATLEVIFILSLTFQKLSLAFKLRYLIQVFIVLEFSWQAYFKSVPDLWICWRIDWDNWQWKRWRQNQFLKNINCFQLQISQPKLHQIEHVGGVSESS